MIGASARVPQLPVSVGVTPEVTSDSSVSSCEMRKTLKLVQNGILSITLMPAAEEMVKVLVPITGVGSMVEFTIKTKVFASFHSTVQSEENSPMTSAAGVRRK